MRIIFSLIVLLFTGTATSLRAQLFELQTSYDNGRYTFIFTDGYYPVTFGVSHGSGAIYFAVPDATQITVPDDWLVTYQEGGFNVSYDGIIEMYPLGFEALEISFSSELSIEEIGSAPGNWSGLVAGPLVLEMGLLSKYSIVGYESFYFDMPAYEGPQITAADLIHRFGFDPDEIQPVAADIKIRHDQIDIYLNNIIEGATYMLQFKQSLTDSNWVNLFTFTSEDLDVNGILTHPKAHLTGFFQVTIL